MADWVSGTPAVSPVANTVLVATDEFTYGRNIRVRVVAKTNVGFEAILQLRAPGNATTRKSQILTIGTTLAVLPPLGLFYVATGERLRLVVRNDVVSPGPEPAEVQASLFIEDAGE